MKVNFKFIPSDRAEEYVVATNFRHRTRTDGPLNEQASSEIRTPVVPSRFRSSETTHASPNMVAALLVTDVMVLLPAESCLSFHFPSVSSDQ